MRQTHSSVAVASGRPHRVLAIDGLPVSGPAIPELANEVTIELDGADHTLRGTSRNVGGSIRFHEKSGDHKDNRVWLIESREDGCYATPQATF